LESPQNDPDGYTVFVIKQLDIAITVLFAFEVIVKIIAYGFMFNGKLSFMKNPWNLLDLLIVIFSVRNIDG
jgi:hypothetical protein